MEGQRHPDLLFCSSPVPVRFPLSLRLRRRNRLFEGVRSTKLLAYPRSTVRIGILLGVTCAKVCLIPGTYELLCVRAALHAASLWTSRHSGTNRTYRCSVPGEQVETDDGEQSMSPHGWGACFPALCEGRLPLVLSLGPPSGLGTASLRPPLLTCPSPCVRP